MQFIKCTRENLLRPLQTVAGIVEGRQTMAILANVLVSKDGPDVTFTATDLEIQIRTKTGIGVGPDSLRTTISVGKMVALLNAIHDSSAEVTLETDNKKILMRSGASRFSLLQLPAEEYPALGQAETTTEVSVPASSLRHVMHMVHFAMAQQDIRYYLNGLLLSISRGQLRAVATDGHRLACCDVDCDIELQEPVNSILPRKSVNQLLKLLPDNDDPVSVSLSKTQICFSFGKIEFLTKLIDYKYPDYNRVIPVNNDKNFTIDRETLIGALRRAAILANEKFKCLRWVLTPGELCVRSANSEMEESVEEMPVAYDGESLDMGFNVTYLLDVLGNIKCSEVNFSFSDQHGATLMTMPGNTQFKYVLMPMRI